MEEKSSFKNWADRTKASIKEREVKKTLLSHWQENKKFYVGIAVGVGTTIVYQAAKHHGTPTNVVGIEGSHNNVEIIGTQNNFAPKRLSYIVTDGDRWWDTQTGAARALGEDPSDVSRHLLHGKELRSGVTLERVGVRS